MSAGLAFIRLGNTWVRSTSIEAFEPCETDGKVTTIQLTSGVTFNCHTSPKEIIDKLFKVSEAEVTEC